MSNELTSYLNSAQQSLNRFNVGNIQKPLSLTNEQQLLDSQNPLSFIDWLNQHTAIHAGDEYREYNNYLKIWYANKASSEETKSTAIRNDYVAFLKELSLLFKDDPQFKYISDIDFDDNLDIEYAIPYFTKKIKEICFYLIAKRESAQKTKLKYNMVGSNQALEKLFYQYLLQAFTRKNTLIQVPEFSGVESLPELSAVGGSFKILIEELNDDTSYFDKTPSGFEVSSASVSSYFVDLGFDLPDYSWIYQSGTMPLCSDNPFFWTLQQLLEQYGVENAASLPFSAVDLSDQLSPSANENNLSRLGKKYSGNDFYVLTGGYYVVDTDVFEYNLLKNNNWFYWPSGEMYTENQDSKFYDAIALNDTSLVESGASYSSDHRTADKIFIQKEDEIRGAWLRYYLRQTETRNMSCAIGGNQTIEFKFPFCDYGIVGDGTDWTGRGISNLDTPYSLLDEDGKKTVDRLYWQYYSTTEQICAIKINDTTLVDDGAYSSTHYVSADKISKRTSTNPNKVNDFLPDSVYTDGFEYAWLYRPLKTDIPIRVGKNTIQWPIQRVEEDSENFLSVGDDYCRPQPLSSINTRLFLGSRAGYKLNDSDILYKLNGRNGYPVECAFLQGVPISVALSPSTIVTGDTNTTFISSVTGVMQTGLTHKCKPDTPETFIWQDPPTPISSLNITYKPHQDDCPFALYGEHASLYMQKDSAEYEFKYPWKECECKTVLYSPIGHPGATYDEYGSMADIVFLDTQDPEPFNLLSWRGSDGLGYQNSSDFAWYKIQKTENNNEQGLDVDVGQGRGEWTTGSGAPFVFKTGKQYKYIRTGIGRSYNELLAESVPPMILSLAYKHAHMPVWKKAVLANDGEWTETAQRSDMVLKAGDYLYYDHYQSNFYCLNYRGTEGTFTTESYNASVLNPTNDFWVNCTFATTGTPIRYSWPSTVHSGYSNIPYTNVAASELSATKWSVTIGASSYTSNLSPEEQLTVISYTPAIIRVSALGFLIGGGQRGVNMTPVSVVEPYLTVTQKTSGERYIQTIYSDTLNYVLNIPLYGWNYETNRYDGVSMGARPFWGKALDDGSLATKNKATREWGQGLRVVDEYTLVYQPEVSFITLNADDAIKYEKKMGGITWVQPVDFLVNDETKEWCDLVVDSQKTSPLSSYLANQNTELVVYPTTTRSDLTLEVGDFVNYWANGEFSWVQALTDSSAGVPPYGGTYVPFASSLLIDSDVPYANLSNRHYPTIAVYPNPENFYSDRESGGYFNHKALGALTFLAKNHVNAINPSLTANQLENGQLFFRDPQVFVSDDIGFTGNTQKGPIVNISFDSRWMKGQITEGNKAGRIKGEQDYKEFSAYQAKEETIGVNANGLIDKGFDLDPWYDEFDDKWRDTVNWPPTFSGQYPVKMWNDSLNLFVKNQRTEIYDKSIKLSAPYFCADSESRNIIVKQFYGTTCLGASTQGTKAIFTNAPILTSLTSDVSSDGGLVLQLNSAYMKNTFLPVYKGDDLTSAVGGYDNILYGERVFDAKAVSYGFVGIEVDGEDFYTPIYRTKRTSCETTNLSARHFRAGTYESFGYMLVYLNESEKGFIRLYTLAD